VSSLDSLGIIMEKYLIIFKIRGWGVTSSLVKKLREATGETISG
jgi:hypothetical protein